MPNIPKPPNYVPICVCEKKVYRVESEVSIVREKEIETYLRVQVKKAGGKAYKFESPGNDGVPDRIVVFPLNRIYFVELKAPGKKPRPLQLKQMRDLMNFGCRVSVLDSIDAVNEFIERVGYAK